MIIDGTALLAICHLLGIFLGDLLGHGLMGPSILFLATKALVR